MIDLPQEISRDVSGKNETRCFYCLGDRPSVHGSLSDLVVLYITDQATSFEEAYREFESFERTVAEPMRLNTIVRSDGTLFFESII